MKYEDLTSEELTEIVTGLDNKIRKAMEKRDKVQEVLWRRKSFQERKALRKRMEALRDPPDWMKIKLSQLDESVKRGAKK